MFYIFDVLFIIFVISCVKISLTDTGAEKKFSIRLALGAWSFTVFELYTKK